MILLLFPAYLGSSQVGVHVALAPVAILHEFRGCMSLPPTDYN